MESMPLPLVPGGSGHRHISRPKTGNSATHLHEVHYHIAMARCWTLGGHFGWANRLFVAGWLGELII
jgi:hypothetical protein